MYLIERKFFFDKRSVTTYDFSETNGHIKEQFILICMF